MSIDRLKFRCIDNMLDLTIVNIKKTDNKIQTLQDLNAKIKCIVDAGDEDALYNCLPSILQENFGSMKNDT